MQTDCPGWLDQRDHHDLPPEAERAIRTAGLAWHDETEADRQLARAEAIAPGHRAVLIARYRSDLYRHRYEAAADCTRRLLAAAAERIGIPAEWHEVTPVDADFGACDPDVRFWLFVLQAHGYVLLRLGRRDTGITVLRRLSELDVSDQTRTAALLQVIERAGVDA
jgi:hypothetical protein